MSAKPDSKVAPAGPNAHHRRRVVVAGVLLASVLLPTALPAEEYTLGLTVVDADSQAPLAARVYLDSAAGTAYYLVAAEEGASAVRYEKQNWINKSSVEYHTTISAHRCTAALPPGNYTLTVERGKSYLPYTEQLQVVDDDLELRVPLKRWVDPAARGWYSGDTHLHRSIDDLRNVVLAEDLNVSFPLTHWVTIAGRLPAAGDKTIGDAIPDQLIQVDQQHVIWPRNTEYEIFTVGQRRHTLGALFVLNHSASIERSVPPWKPVAEWSRAQDPDVLFDMDKLDWPFAMLLPTIVPHPLYELANNHVWRTEFAFRTWNSPAPPYMQPPFGGTEGGERQWLDYTLGMYYTLLNCGLRLPPSAGTANGVHPVPAGYSRVYVHLPEGFDYSNWLTGLRAGRSFVTTGPMLFATADSHDPGHTFRWNSSELPAKEIPLQIEVLSEKPLSFGEIIINGRAERLLRVKNERTAEGTYRNVMAAAIAPQRSGWFAVRCWEQRPGERTRFAHTAPWYVEIDDQPVRLNYAEKQYLLRRISDEIERSMSVVSDEAMNEYRQALRFYEALPVLDDAEHVARNARPATSEPELQQWLENMIIHHRFTPDEVRLATGLSLEQAQQAQQQMAGSTAASQAPDQQQRQLLVLPYPGGRHPRRGFLEGAVDPQRETKVSVFLPWKESGYVVGDVPEAIFSNLGLTYLAHTHIPTIWSERDIDLPPLEWQRTGDALVARRTLPNGIEFESRVMPQADFVAMQMTLTNGTDQPLTGLRSQVCVMLKGAPGFNAQVDLPHLIQEPFVAVRAENSDRWIITAWKPCQRAWTNPPVPCIHSDPIFPDCQPGQTVQVRGGLWFYEGAEIEEQIKRLAETFRDARPSDVGSQRR